MPDEAEFISTRPLNEREQQSLADIVSFLYESGEGVSKGKLFKQFSSLCRSNKTLFDCWLAAMVNANILSMKEDQFVKDGRTISYWKVKTKASLRKAR